MLTSTFSIWPHVRNLSCHAHLRRMLIERRVVGAVKAAESSVFPEVVEWASEILRLMEKDLNVRLGIGELFCRL